MWKYPGTVHLQCLLFVTIDLFASVSFVNHSDFQVLVLYSARLLQVGDDLIQCENHHLRILFKLHQHGIIKYIAFQLYS